MASEPDNQDPGNSSHPPGAVVIKVFSTATAAEAAAALLDANNITCWLQADDCGGMLSALDAAHGVKLLVSPTDADEAQALLTAAPVAAAGLTPDDSSTAGANSTPQSPRLKLSLPQIITGIVIGVLLCLLYQWTAKLGTRTYRQDTNRDGKADDVWTYRDGHLIEHFQDRDFDGVLDAWTYYEHGQVARAELDNNFDGKADETWIYSNAVLVGLEQDNDFNGTADLFCTYKFHIIQQSDMRPNGSKFTTQRDYFRNGVLTEIWRGGDSNGNFKEVVRYDPFFNQISTNIPASQLLSPSSK